MSAVPVAAATPTVQPRFHPPASIARSATSHPLRAGCEAHVDNQDVIVHDSRIVRVAQLDRGRQANSRRLLPTASLGYGNVELMIELTTKDHETR